MRSILVLLRSKAATPELEDKLTYWSGGKRVLFEYDLIRLWEEPIEPFLHGGIGLVPLAPLCKLPEQRTLESSIRTVIGEIDRRLASLPDHAKAVRLMTATFVLTALRVENKNLSRLFEGVKIMHKVAWDEFTDQGRVHAHLHDLLTIGRKRLGAPSARAEKALSSIDDPDRLERMMAVILDVKSWKSLLAVK